MREEGSCFFLAQTYSKASSFQALASVEVKGKKSVTLISTTRLWANANIIKCPFFQLQGRALASFWGVLGFSPTSFRLLSGDQCRTTVCAIWTTQFEGQTRPKLLPYYFTYLGKNRACGRAAVLDAQWAKMAKIRLVALRPNTSVFHGFFLAVQKQRKLVWLRSLAKFGLIPRK